VLVGYQGAGSILGGGDNDRVKKKVTTLIKIGLDAERGQNQSMGFVTAFPPARYRWFEYMRQSIYIKLFTVTVKIHVLVSGQIEGEPEIMPMKFGGRPVETEFLPTVLQVVPRPVVRSPGAGLHKLPFLDEVSVFIGVVISDAGPPAALLAAGFPDRGEVMDVKG